MPQTSAQEHRRSGLPTASKAPKARLIPAWGEAPCTRESDAQGLKARPIDISLPQIPLVPFHSIFLEKCAELILKRLLPVMHLLTVDVIDQRTQVRRPNRERGVAPLPRELRQVGRLGFKPLGRGRFKFFDQLSYVCRAGQANGKMNVVRDSTNAKAFTFGIASNSSKVRIECRTNRRTKEGGAVFCAEDHVDQNKCERLWHRVDYRSGFQPSCSTANRTWGFTPCWYKGAPLALPQSVKIALV